VIDWVCMLMVFEVAQYNHASNTSVGRRVLGDEKAR
jgi:hypothetical protein